MIFLPLVALVTASPPPVVVSTAGRMAPSRQEGEAVDFDVEIKAGDQSLWSGPMRVSNRVSATFNSDKHDASTEICVNDPSDFGSGNRSRLSVTLRMLPYGDRRDLFALTLSWEHPSSDRHCNRDMATRTVGLTENFTLGAGQETRLRGDGGLVVHIRRHADQAE